MAHFGTLCVALLLQACQSAQAHSTHFVSNKGFSLDYPAGWTRYGSSNGIGASHTRLEIISSDDIATGVGIKEHQADITVEKVENPQQVHLIHEMRRGRISGERIIGFSKPYSLQLGICSNLLETKTDVEIAPGANMTYHRYVCNNGDDNFLLTLRYWRNDGKASLWKKVALKILESIKSTPQS